MARAKNRLDQRCPVGKMYHGKLYISIDGHCFRTDVIFLAHLNDNIVIDKIPMSEVELVGEMRSLQTSSDAAELMIETHPDGYNSGRIYYLQAESKGTCHELIQKLKQDCAAAHERANAKTAMTQAQQYVRKLHRSKLFQNFVALLIIAVCKLKMLQVLSNIEVLLLIL